MIGSTEFDPFASEEISPAQSAEWEAKRRVAAALRELDEVLVSSTPPVDALHALATRLELTARDFARHPRLFGRLAFVEDGSHGNFRQIAHELNPLSGISNPLAPPLNIWIDGDTAHGRATLGWAYEGPPGSVHGGYVAALFDQFMGMAQAIGGQPGMTGTLTIRYRRRTPLNTELHMKGGITRLDGRKTFVHATLHADGVLTAECEGVFVCPAGGFGFLIKGNPATPPG